MFQPRSSFRKRWTAFRGLSQSPLLVFSGQHEHCLRTDLGKIRLMSGFLIFTVEFLTGMKVGSIGIEGPLSHAGSPLLKLSAALQLPLLTLSDEPHHQISDTQGVLDVECVDERA